MSKVTVEPSARRVIIEGVSDEVIESLIDDAKLKELGKTNMTDNEIKKLVINVRTEAIKEVLAEITKILHEAEMHGNYEPSLTIEIINDIKKKMGADNG